MRDSGNHARFLPHRSPSETAPKIRRHLLGWFDRHRRDLPWRRTGDPYAIWLSEMMLQQTQVATVIPYYERFLAAFPTVGDLAAADLDDVLRLWAGLGYYARARNMHRAARMVAEECGGLFPKTVDELMGLPGVGRYTAGAIASIAFGTRAAVVDGNVIRVLSRLFLLDQETRSAAGRERVWEIAERLLPRERCGDFNQAVMELGATVCLRGAAARCAACPVRSQCAAHAAGRVAALPVVGERTAPRVETHVVIALRQGERWLFERRPDDGLWGGLWALPSQEPSGRGGGRGDEGGRPTALAERLMRALRWERVDLDGRPFCRVEHQLTHKRIRFVGYIGRGRGAAPKGGRPAKGLRWASLEEAQSFGYSAAVRKILDALADVARP